MTIEEIHSELRWYHCFKVVKSFKESNKDREMFTKKIAEVIPMKHKKWRLTKMFFMCFFNKKLVANAIHSEMNSVL